ncbi:MAG: DNA primase, partial [Clostridia bacterium]|nr:DNA primase [Clostridia bacterium]
MAGRFPPAWLDELRARADIVQVVSSYVPLKRNGHRYWGLCPFHNEKTASFSVDAERQLYHCFGCKAGGSVIQFVMEIERLEFQEAVKLLADQLHMALPQMEEDPNYQKRRDQRQRLQELNRAAAQYFHQLLYRPQGQKVLEYLHGRGLDDGVIRRFGLGASPQGWDELIKAMTADGYTVEEMRIAGLCVVKENKSFDMFRNRAIFPIIDAHGNVLGFGGRIMGEGQPKYLNTPDTPVFNKRQGVYAANLLRKCRNLKRVILVEGYMDVVALSQFGVQGVVATLGTALTQEQARLLKRYAPQVYVAYDGDSAGQHAILRALEIFEQEEMPAKVLDFPGGQDPDEFIRAHGVEAFEALQPISAAAYRMRRREDEFDLSTQDGRTEYAKACAAILRKVDQPVDLENLLTQLALKTGFSREVLLAQMDLKLPEKVHSPKPMREKWSPKAAVSEGRRAQQTLLSLMATGRLPQGTVTAEDFADERLRALGEALLAGQSVPSLVEQQATQEEQAQVSQWLMSPGELSQDQLLKMAQECLNNLRCQRIEE